MISEQITPERMRELDKWLNTANGDCERLSDDSEYKRGYLVGCAVGKAQEAILWELRLDAYVNQLAGFREDMAAEVPTRTVQQLTNEELAEIGGSAA